MEYSCILMKTVEIMKNREKIRKNQGLGHSIRFYTLGQLNYFISNILISFSFLDRDA